MYEYVCIYIYIYTYMYIAVFLPPEVRDLKPGFG